MAKDKKVEKSDTKGKAKKADAKAEKTAEREFKFGVEELAEMLDIKPASVRVQLRNHGIEKAGKSYGWDTKAELKEIVDQIKSGKDEEDEKPAKKGKAAKDEPKAKGGKSKTKAVEKTKPSKGKKKPADDEDEDDDDD